MVPTRQVQAMEKLRQRLGIEPKQVGVKASDQFYGKNIDKGDANNKKRWRLFKTKAMTAAIVKRLPCSAACSTRDGSKGSALLVEAFDDYPRRELSSSFTKGAFKDTPYIRDFVWVQQFNAVDDATKLEVEIENERKFRRLANNSGGNGSPDGIADGTPDENGATRASPSKRPMNGQKIDQAARSGSIVAGPNVRARKPSVRYRRAGATKNPSVGRSQQISPSSRRAASPGSIRRRVSGISSSSRRVPSHSGRPPSFGRGESSAFTLHERRNQHESNTHVRNEEDEEKKSLTKSSQPDDMAVPIESSASNRYIGRDTWASPMDVASVTKVGNSERENDVEVCSPAEVEVRMISFNDASSRDTVNSSLNDSTSSLRLPRNDVTSPSEGKQQPEADPAGAACPGAESSLGRDSSLTPHGSFPVDHGGGGDAVSPFNHPTPSQAREGIRRATPRGIGDDSPTTLKALMPGTKTKTKTKTKFGQNRSQSAKSLSRISSHPFFALEEWEQCWYGGDDVKAHTDVLRDSNPQLFPLSMFGNNNNSNNDQEGFTVCVKAINTGKESGWAGGTENKAGVQGMVNERTRMDNYGKCSEGNAAVVGGSNRSGGRVGNGGGCENKTAQRRESLSRTPTGVLVENDDDNHNDPSPAFTDRSASREQLFMRVGEKPSFNNIHMTSKLEQDGDRSASREQLFVRVGLLERRPNTAPNGTSFRGSMGSRRKPQLQPVRLSQGSLPFCRRVEKK